MYAIYGNMDHQYIPIHVSIYTENHGSVMGIGGYSIDK